MNTPFVVGIAPGTTTGLVAYCLAEHRLVRAGSLPFWKAVAIFRELADSPGVALCIVEDSRRLPARRNWGDLGQTAATANRSAGHTDRDTVLWLSLCDRLGIPSHAALPVRLRSRGTAHRKLETRWSTEMTEYERRAARLALKYQHLAPPTKSLSPSTA